MTRTDAFIEAYRKFKESVDFDKSGILPDLDNLVCWLLMGVPRVPADEESSPRSSLEALEQRVMILKAVFTELNQGALEEFVDRGLAIYDLAEKKARILLQQMDCAEDIPLSFGKPCVSERTGAD